MKIVHSKVSFHIMGKKMNHLTNDGLKLDSYFTLYSEIISDVFKILVSKKNEISLASPECTHQSLKVGHSFSRSLLIWYIRNYGGLSVIFLPLLN